MPEQTGFELGQSLDARHPTQEFVVVLQIGVEPPHVFVHVMAVPQLLVAGPHALPEQAAVLSAVHPHALAPAPPPPQLLGEVQVFVQVTVWPQLLVAGPQALPAQAAVLSAVHPHPLTPAEPPLQTLGEVQVFVQVTVWPQLLVAGPHALPAQAAVLSGTHWQDVVGEPAHVSLVAHAVHFVLSPQPLLASVGTHLSPHCLVPVPQVPTTQALPWQTKVAPPETVGQAVASHVVAPQPYAGSVSDTHFVPHFFVPEGQVPITHALD